MRSVALLVMSAVLVLSAETPAQPPEPKKDEKKGIDRTGKTRKRLLKDFGGSEESEEAVMLGLAWLTQQQKQDGHWVYDGERPGFKGKGAVGPGTFASETSGATGMAVLAYLGAGQSHKEGRYKQTVKAGVDWLVNDLTPAGGKDGGKFRGSNGGNGQIYCQGIATLALCEAYGVTQDEALREPAQRAIDYIQRIQAQNGSWGYRPGSPGDTSIVGWQVQALHAAQLAGLTVDEKVVRKAVEFLNYVSTGPNKAVYGYNVPGQVLRKGVGNATALSAIGLLMRYYIDGWRDTNKGFAEGTQTILTRAKTPDGKQPIDELYFYYYAAQVARFHGGEEWKTWNEGPKQPDGTRKGGLHDWLIALQCRDADNRGSWDPERGSIGLCGRHGTTCMCLLTLQVYYRYTPEDGENAPKKP